MTVFPSENVDPRISVGLSRGGNLVVLKAVDWEVSVDTSLMPGDAEILATEIWRCAALARGEAPSAAAGATAAGGRPR